MPGVGKVRARKIMEKLDISRSRRVRGLGSKQKDALLAEFAAEVAAPRRARGSAAGSRPCRRPVRGRQGHRRPRVLDARPDVGCAVSYTTRPPRPGEVDGDVYQFVSDEEFDGWSGTEAFLE